MDIESPVSHIPGVHEIPLIIRTADSESLRATCFAGRGARASVALFPEMGVEASFYRGFCQSLAADGYNALALDLRGHGGHSVRVDRQWRFGYREMLLNDWPVAVKTLRGLFPGLRVYIVGHGLGGYLSALHASLRPRDIDGLALIGAGSTYFRSKPWRQGLSELAFTQFAWSLSEIVGFYPGDAMGTGVRESVGVMRDRAHHVRTGAYFPRDMQKSERSVFDDVRMPLLGVSFTDDELCSRRSSELLTACFPAANVTRWHLSPADIGVESIGHYAWARQRDVFVRMLAEWIG